MENYGNFVFGRQVKKMEQKDTSPKKVFVLGVYASAVHARWESADRKASIRALAVDSEPYIFWRGENAGELVSNINLPPEAGILKAASAMFNGPSGRTLDENIFEPLGFNRDKAWLCDLIPYSLKNKRQEEALRRLETTLKKLDLPFDTRKNDSARKIDDNRVSEILHELKASKAELIITLGNEPIKYFINCLDHSINSLSQDTYGEVYDIRIDQNNIKLLPIVHPRHIKGMIGSSKIWTDIHKKWIDNLKSWKYYSLISEITD